MALQAEFPVSFPALSSISVDGAADTFAMTRAPEPTDFERFVLPWSFSLRLDSAALCPRRRSRPRVVSDDDDTADKIPRESLFYTFASNLSQEEREALCRSCYAEICNLQSARETRVNQRWARNPSDHNMIVRLVTGCIPILSDGRVLLIGSARKKVQLVLGLPKGGWETDECLEKGAMRETFEEAGVLGVLGAPLPTFLSESKKKMKHKSTSGGGSIEESISSASSWSSTHTASSSTATLPVFCNLGTLVPLMSSDDESSSSSTNPVHTHTCTTFFPLYVTEVKKDWPEHTRERRAYPIEEAIHVVRPELRWMLEHIQREGLHE